MDLRPTDTSVTHETIRAAVRAALIESTHQVDLARIDDRTDFFAIGLDSMAVASMVARLQERLGFDIPLAAVFEHSNVGDLVVFLDDLKRVEAPPPPRPAALGEYFLAPMMTNHLARRMGPDWERTPVPTWAAVELTAGTMDADVLRSALDTLVQRHEALRVSLHRSGDVILARLDPAASIPLEVVDAPDADDRELDRMVLRLRERLFDRTKAPLAAVTLIRRADVDLLCMVIDHSMSDLLSLRMLLLEIGRLCAGLPLADPAGLTLSQWCSIERQVLADDGKSAAEFWSEMLEPHWPATETAAGLGAAPDRWTHRGFEVGAESRRRLLERAAAEGVTPFALFAGHLLHAVRTVMGVSQVPLIVQSLNRDLLGTSELVASPVRELWLSVDVAERETPEQAAASFQERLLSGLGWQMTPPSLVLGGRSAWFDAGWTPWIYFSVNLYQMELDFPSGKARLRSIPMAKESSAPLDLRILDRGDRLVFELTTWPTFLTEEQTDELARVLARSAAFGPPPEIEEAVAGEVGKVGVQL
ncbi:hypothetical protein GCM10010300_51690 [Streptomyces olivaceoviridis]|uniref:condensation domain-containing protein n=1 Tax=Streptomyces olivaceoviridis TaxID=1921 RepID=UPI001675D0F5|nr:condensation domain-containing protein [Streptomyces olivaceoviridis]GGZ01362.1 hypothetical protein GCM10010300_51690 [Streptomyces olivaceoviridis]